MKTIIAGSRKITDYDILEAAIAASGFTITEVISGGAKGVDSLGEWFATKNEIPLKVFPYLKKYGKAGGPIRNEQMADYAEALIALWDGESRGTAHMINAAKIRGLRVYVEMI